MPKLTPIIHAATCLGLFACASSLVHAKSLLIDFGRSDGANGDTTLGVDTNGNHWNNVFSTGVGVPANQVTGPLVATDNSATTVRLTVSAGWQANGIQNGGLKTPSAALLGDFAIPTVTHDYYFLDSNTPSATITLTGLTPGITYDLDIFGTRNSGDNRVSGYSVTDVFGAHFTTLQTSGAGSGAEGSIGNDDTLASLTGLVPNGTTMVLKVSIENLGSAFAYVGAMRITEGPAAPAPPTVFIDFGRTASAVGNPTVSPDNNGNHWNNLASSGQTPASTFALTDLVDTKNRATSIDLTLSSGWSSNGGTGFGGLPTPNAGLLGEFAIPTATEDYYFIGGGVDTETVKFSGLTQGLVYDLSMFATRNTTETRTTGYSVTDANGPHFTTLQTSGTGAGAAGSIGNDDTIATLNGLVPNSAGEIIMTVSSQASDFAYIGAMKVGVRMADIPAPASMTRWVAQDKLDPVAPGSVLFVGSSSIRRWEALSKDFADYRITQRGFGGSQFPELIAGMDFIVRPYQPSAIVVWEGTNDIRGGGKTAAQIHADFQTFVSLVRETQPTTPIFYLGITPTPAYLLETANNSTRLATNALISATCAGDATLHYIDLPAFFEGVQANQPATFQSYYTDDTHFNRKGYTEWTRIIRQQLTPVVSPNKVFAANANTPAVGERFLFDFGPSDGANGDATNGTDVRGNFWNNWHATNGGGGVNSGEHLANLIKSTGANSGIRMTITGGFLVNGKQNGGLLAPSASLLGDFAVSSVSQDYFFCTADDLYSSGDDDTPGGFKMEGLDPTMSYDIRLFGSRDAANPARVTEYWVSGLNEKKQNLQTSGSDIGSNGTYDGNDDEVTLLTGIVPNAFGEIFIDLTAVQGQFAYVAAMEVKASAVLAPIALWRVGKFTPAELENPALEATLWGNAADPDSDDRNNLLEYATGTLPKTNDANPVTSALEQVGEDQILSLTYRKNLAATDVAFQVLASEDLVSGDPIADTFLSASNGLETRKASVPVADFAKRFLRLNVVKTP